MTATTPTLLDAALELAADGWFVFPLHSPLHDHPAGYTCTCEEYRHTDRCRERDASRKAKGRPPQYLPPDQHCDKPGKHPWGVASWSKESTRDPARIRAWWSRYPDANIGGDCGKSNRLALDADLYKERYAGGTSGRMNLAHSAQEAEGCMSSLTGEASPTATRRASCPAVSTSGVRVATSP